MIVWYFFFSFCYCYIDVNKTGINEILMLVLYLTHALLIVTENKSNKQLVFSLFIHHKLFPFP